MSEISVMLNTLVLKIVSWRISGNQCHAAIDKNTGISLHMVGFDKPLFVIERQLLRNKYVFRSFGMLNPFDRNQPKIFHAFV